MKITMEITDEMYDEIWDKIFLSDMKEAIKTHEEDLITMKKTKEGIGHVSWDYKEDKKEVKKLLKALRIVFEYYGGKT